MNKDDIYTEFLSRLSDETIDTALDVVRLCMEVVDKKDIEGPKKSAMVYECIQAMLQDDQKPLCLTDNILNDLNLLLDGNILQQTMTAIVDAAKGRFDISKPTNTQKQIHQQVHIRKWGAQLWGY